MLKHDPSISRRSTRPAGSSSLVLLPTRLPRPRRCETWAGYQHHNLEHLPVQITFHITACSPNPPKAARSVGPQSRGPRLTFRMARSSSNNGRTLSTSTRMPPLSRRRKDLSERTSSHRRTRWALEAVPLRHVKGPALFFPVHISLLGSRSTHSTLQHLYMYKPKEYPQIVCLVRLLFRCTNESDRSRHD